MCCGPAAAWPTRPRIAAASRFSVSAGPTSAERTDRAHARAGLRDRTYPDRPGLALHQRDHAPTFAAEGDTRGPRKSIMHRGVVIGEASAMKVALAPP